MPDASAPALGERHCHAHSILLLLLLNTFSFMHLDTTPLAPPRKPCLRDLAQLTSPTGLLPAAVLPLLPLKQLRRRANEIAATHPQYREELPLVLAYEAQRRRRFTSGLVVSVSQIQAA